MILPNLIMPNLIMPNLIMLSCPGVSEDTTPAIDLPPFTSRAERQLP